MKNLIIALLAVTAIAFASCGDSCDLEAFATRSNQNLTAGQAYAADSTDANCEAYKSDLEDLISEYEDCDDATISAQVTLFQGQLGNLPCN